ncbi:hypothetical protein [Ruthenibacterium lactatiformans]|uniref:Uncharacterized protein n=1 Tax=Ruthenibacterium lactatiformans TaxID=1550024 RepID=A0A6I3QDL0_9FIRM|nr:hypothetical protein [Ruthenibacterium lactatiformans]MTS17096.1 hypothetical protein [Ruthenibacterium lactatiformans]MTS20452.1 hypothetical protein [Ruthenibacterium lactatiformans]MTS49846.1 hypothetical protein [Ruthenibacterium lactatiformans]MTS53204.1 hypothetical protein [Ruthenibacterium lactatiformans]
MMHLWMSKTSLRALLLMTFVKPSVKQELENIRKEQAAKKEEKAKPPQRQNKTPGRNRRKKKKKSKGR